VDGCRARQPNRRQTRKFRGRAARRWPKTVHRREGAGPNQQGSNPRWLAGKRCTARDRDLEPPNTKPRQRKEEARLGGELVSMTLHLMGKRRLLLSIPFAVAEVQARLFELLPNPPLTSGQVDLLKADNVASRNLPGLQELKIQPKTVEEVVPTYIGTRAQGPQ
jgi:hypothetical protein